MILRTLILFISIISILSYPADAASKSERAKLLRLKQESKREILRQSQGRLNAEKAKLSEINEKESAVSGRLKTTEAALWQTESDIRDIIYRKERTIENIAIKEQNIIAMKEKIKISQQNLALRLREVNKQQLSSYWAVLFKSDNFYDFITKLDFIKRITQNDVRQIKDLKEKRAQLEREEKELRALKASLEAEEVDYRKKQVLQMSLRKEQKGILDEVSGQRDEQASWVYELELITREQNSQLESLIRQEQSLNSPSRAAAPAKKSFAQSGSYIWPCRGIITSPYGYRWHPIRGGNIFHSGIDIGADYGVPIRATASGIVIMAGWYGGYGNCIIVDHGKGWSSLYGHCNAIFVGKGQAVGQGTSIGSVGSTGMSTGPHLHFEIRYNGSPVDPCSKL
ncbi:MAG: peptidoglycan DD-metalloendopeptidase family protein [bacterium]|nr:peptidoglycan DD-metalloendopeptidase family protein [bacterium]